MGRVSYIPAPQYNPYTDPWFMAGNTLGSMWRQNYDNRGAANAIQDASNMQTDLNQYNQYQQAQSLLDDWQNARAQYDAAPNEQEKQKAAAQGSLIRDSLFKLGFNPVKYNANTDPTTLSAAYQTTMDQLNALDQKTANNKSWHPQRISALIGKGY